MGKTCFFLWQLLLDAAEPLERTEATFLPSELPENCPYKAFVVSLCATLLP